MNVAGRFLYGAPASNLDLDGDVTIAAAEERPGFAGYQFGLADDEVDPTKQTLDDLPSTDDDGKATFNVNLDKLPSTDASAAGRCHAAHERTGRSRRRAQADAADHARGQYDRHQAAVPRHFARRRRQRQFRRDRRRAGRQDAGASAGCTISCCASRRIISSTSATACGISSRSRPRPALPTARSMWRRTNRGGFRCR